MQRHHGPSKGVAKQAQAGVGGEEQGGMAALQVLPRPQDHGPSTGLKAAPPQPGWYHLGGGGTGVARGWHWGAPAPTPALSQAPTASAFSTQDWTMLTPDRKRAGNSGLGEQGGVQACKGTA